MKPQTSQNALVKISAKTSYQELESEPGSQRHIFAYKIKIENQGTGPLQLLARHWIIKDALERIEEVKGIGVVGQQPKIKAGEFYEYESFCPLPTKTGSMRGWYEFQNELGERFLVEIPEFYFFDVYNLH